VLSLQAAADLDASTKLPADAAAQQQVAQLVVGSLDINQGAVLPAEDLVGRLPTVRHSWRSWQKNHGWLELAESLVCELVWFQLVALGDSLRQLHHHRHHG
jgi:hypothetical protein